MNLDIPEGSLESFFPVLEQGTKCRLPIRLVSLFTSKDPVVVHSPSTLPLGQKTGNRTREGLYGMMKCFHRVQQQGLLHRLPLISVVEKTSLNLRQEGLPSPYWSVSGRSTRPVPSQVWYFLHYSHLPVAWSVPFVFLGRFKTRSLRMGLNLLIDYREDEIKSP